MPVLKYFSLFSGIGGFELGIQRVRTKNVATQNKSRCTEKAEQTIRMQEGQCGKLSDRNPIRFTCVGFSEIDKYAIQIYKKHFPKHKEYGDVSKITWSDVEDFEMVVGGFPCQAFSIAGKRKGFNDTRGTLFFEIVRCLREKQPRLLLLENVKGLLSHDKGRTFGTILNTLDELGYDLQWQVLNSKNFGVPQNRERVFVVGHLRGTRRPEIFPINGFCMGKTHPAVCLTRRGYGSQRNGTYVATHSSETNKLRRITNGKLDDRTLESETGFPENREMSGMQREKENRIPPQKRGLARSSTRKHSGDMPQLPQQNTSSQGEMQDLRQANEGSGLLRETLSEIQEIRQSQDVQKKPAYSNYRIRRLTPLEAERLQGFPDGWTKGISDTQRYKCLGNAVTVNVIEAIMSKLITQ